MKHRLRSAAIFAGAFTYGAFWIAFVMLGHQTLPSDRPQNWLLSALAALLLMGVLFLTGFFVASKRRTGPRQPLEISTVIVALITVGVLFGMVSALRIVLWSGPTWLRWSVVGLAIAALIVVSGQARGYTVAGGLLGSAIGIWFGRNRDGVASIDLVLTSVTVWSTLGAVMGTLLLSGRGDRPIKHGR